MLTAVVIGCGHGGGLSLDALRKSSHYELLGAADPSSDARKCVAARHSNIRLFADSHQMLVDCPVDVICIATPAPSHVSVARAALEHDPRGLLLEKPLATDVVTAGELLQEIRDAELPLVVPHGMLVLPAMQEIKARIREGVIGVIQSVEVQNAVDLLNAGIHWLTYLIDVFDNDVPRIVSTDFDVSGHVVNDGVRVESRGTTRLEFQSGVLVQMHSGNKTKPTSKLLPRVEQRGALFRVTGSNGVMEFSAWAGSYLIQVGDSSAELIRRPPAPGFSYHQIFLEQLARSIASGRPNYNSAELSLAALRLIQSAYQQQRYGDWSPGEPAG